MSSTLDPDPAFSRSAGMSECEDKRRRHQGWARPDCSMSFMMTQVARNLTDGVDGVLIG
jgi:hypothetical protein